MLDGVVIKHELIRSFGLDTKLNNHGCKKRIRIQTFKILSDSRRRRFSLAYQQNKAIAMPDLIQN